MFCTLRVTMCTTKPQPRLRVHALHFHTSCLYYSNIAAILQLIKNWKIPIYSEKLTMKFLWIIPQMDFFFPKSCSLRLIFYFFALSTTMLYCQLSSKNSLRERGFWTMEPEKCLINVVFSSIALFNTSKNFFCRSFFPRRSLLHTTKRIFDVGNRAKKNFVPTDYNIFIWIRNVYVKIYEIYFHKKLYN